MLPDGVFLHLPFADYLRENAMGSTKKATLWLRREGFYWKYLAPYRRTEDKAEELLFGECAHAALLEGLHAYESRYIVEPSKRDHPDALYTVGQIQAALKGAGVYPPGSSKFVKEDWAEVAEAYLPDRPVWDNVLADFSRRLGNGRRSVPADVDFAIRAMRDLAIGEHSTEELRELLSVGQDFPILAEVSVFYTDPDGLRHCARFDKLLPPTTADMKTLGNWSGRELEHAVDKHIKDMAYDVQCADYQEARRVAMAMIRDSDGDCIHGGTEEEVEHLIALAHYDLTQKPSFSWLWFQKPTAAGNPPVLFPVLERWGGPYHRAGFRKRHVALQTYRDCMAKFGPDKPWGRVERTHITEEREGIPHITLGHYGWGPDAPVEGEEEYFRG